jgi:hypothetical protein
MYHLLNSNITLTISRNREFPNTRTLPASRITRQKCRISQLQVRGFKHSTDRNKTTRSRTTPTWRYTFSSPEYSMSKISCVRISFQYHSNRTTNIHELFLLGSEPLWRVWSVSRHT